MGLKKKDKNDFMKKNAILNVNMIDIYSFNVIIVYISKNKFFSCIDNCQYGTQIKFSCRFKTDFQRIINVIKSAFFPFCFHLTFNFETF